MFNGKKEILPYVLGEFCKEIDLASPLHYKKPLRRMLKEQSKKYKTPLYHMERERLIFINLLYFSIDYSTNDRYDFLLFQLLPFVFQKLVLVLMLLNHF